MQEVVRGVPGVREVVILHVSSTTRASSWHHPLPELWPTANGASCTGERGSQGRSTGGGEEEGGAEAWEPWGGTRKAYMCEFQSALYACLYPMCPVCLPVVVCRWCVWCVVCVMCRAVCRAMCRAWGQSTNGSCTTCTQATAWGAGTWSRHCQAWGAAMGRHGNQVLGQPARRGPSFSRGSPPRPPRWAAQR